MLIIDRRCALTLHERWRRQLARAVGQWLVSEEADERSYRSHTTTAKRRATIAESATPGCTASFVVVR